jgi:bifunctional DNA-binding transcriptional regulator/antitoxin component of YhaV-PrlF toxin-antitoxin module
MGIVKVGTNNRITLPKDIIEFLNMEDTKQVCVVILNNETFLIKKQLNKSDTKNFFIDIRSIHKNYVKKTHVNYRFVIPPNLIRKMSIKIGDYVYVYVDKNKNIVVTTKF